jgi:hypothetical protein
VIRPSLRSIVLKVVLALATVAAALVVPSATAVPFSCSSGMFALCVSVGPDGITPAEVTLFPGQAIWFAGETSERVTWDELTCADPVRATLPAPGSVPCSSRLRRPGRYTFRVRGLAGTAVVQEPEWATITSSKTTVLYREHVALSGTVYAYPHFGGPPPVPLEVTVVARPAIGSPVITRVSALPPRTLGAEWSMSVYPGVTTSYEARTGEGSSRELVVTVRPRVDLRRERGRLRVRVEPGRRFARRWAALQRRAGDGSWQRVVWLRLGRHGAATIRRELPRGAVVRAYVPRSPGYASGFSEPLTLPARERPRALARRSAP